MKEQQNRIIENLIAFEGADGTGKTTLSKTFIEKMNLTNTGVEFKYFAIPTHDEPIGKNIIRPILAGDVQVKHPLTLQYLIHAEDLEFEEYFTDDNKDLHLMGVRDRSYISAIVYSKLVIKNNPKYTTELNNFHNLIINSAWPEYIILLQADKETLNRRISSRKGKVEIFDAPEYAEMLAELYDYKILDKFIEENNIGTKLIVVQVDSDNIETNVERIIEGYKFLHNNQHLHTVYVGDVERE